MKQAIANPEPHTPNGNRYIRIDSGSVTYIIKEKEKDMVSFLSACTFHSTFPEKEQVIESVLKQLNNNN